MDEVIQHILTAYDTITVVGASIHDRKPAHGVPDLMQAHGWRVIPASGRAA